MLVLCVGCSSWLGLTKLVCVLVFAAPRVLRGPFVCVGTEVPNSNSAPAAACGCAAYGIGLWWWPHCKQVLTTVSLCCNQQVWSNSTSITRGVQCLRMELPAWWQPTIQLSLSLVLNASNYSALPAMQGSIRRIRCDGVLFVAMA